MIKKFCDACGVDITEEKPFNWFDVSIQHHNTNKTNFDKIGFELHVCKNCVERNALGYLRNAKTLDKIREKFLWFIKEVHEGRE